MEKNKKNRCPRNKVMVKGRCIADIEIKDYNIDKFKKFLRREGLPTDKATVEHKLNNFIEQNLDLIM